MKLILFAFVAMLSMSAHADQVFDLLKKYETSDLNRRCSVAYDQKNRFIEIKGSEIRPQEFWMSFNSLKFERGILTGEYGNYDGHGEVFFIEKFNSDGSPRSLMVVGTWHDNDNSYDRSAFCELNNR